MASTAPGVVNTKQLPGGGWVPYRKEQIDDNFRRFAAPLRQCHAPLWLRGPKIAIGRR